MTFFFFEGALNVFVLNQGKNSKEVKNRLSLLLFWSASDFAVVNIKLMIPVLLFKVLQMEESISPNNAVLFNKKNCIWLLLKCWSLGSLWACICIVCPKIVVYRYICHPLLFFSPLLFYKYHLLGTFIPS